MKIDFAPRLDDEIELCGQCGERVARLGLDAAPYCYKCGDRGTVEPVRYRKVTPSC